MNFTVKAESNTFADQSGITKTFEKLLCLELVEVPPT